MRKYAGGFILLVLSLLFIIGEQTVAGPCPVMPDGRFMVCHWAGQAVLGVGIVLVVLSLLHLAFKNDGMKLGLDLAVIADAVLLLMIPNRLIHLCMKNHMQCHTVMEPFVLVMGVLMIAAALGDFFFRRRVVRKRLPMDLNRLPWRNLSRRPLRTALSSCLPFSFPLSFLPDP
ncbi:MAG: DUF4418 family protein [Dialister invisus]